MAPWHVYGIGTLYNLCHGFSEHKLHLYQVLKLYGTTEPKGSLNGFRHNAEDLLNKTIIYCTLLVMILGPQNVILPSEEI